MRKSAIFMACAAAGLVLAACSQQTQDKAEQTAESVGADVGGAAAEATQAIDDAARSVDEAVDKTGDAVNEAADKASTAASRIGDKVEEGADKARAHIHEETAPDKH